MAYEFMKTTSLKEELFRRAIDIDSWANEINLKKAEKDVLDELDKSEEFIKQAEIKLDKVIKRCKIFKCLTAISFILCVVSIILPFILRFYFNNTEIYKNGFIPFIILSFSTMFLSIFTKADVNLKNEHHVRAELLYWYYVLLKTAYSKSIYKKTYEDVYKVIDKLCEDKNIKNKIENIKKEFDINFSYLKGNNE